MADRANDPEIDIQHQVARQEERRIVARRATQRLIGSYFLGGVATWKLLTYEVGAPVPWYVWVGMAVVSFGLASFDQVVKVFFKR